MRGSRNIRALAVVVYLLSHACRDFDDAGTEMPDSVQPGNAGDGGAQGGSAALPGERAGGAGGAADAPSPPIAGEPSSTLGGGAGAPPQQENGDGGRGVLDESTAGGGSGGVEGTEQSLFEPPEFSQLRLWLAATPAAWDPGNQGGAAGAGGTQNATAPSWRDASLHGNDAISDPSTGAPRFIVGAVNGHSAVRFGPRVTTLTILDDESLQFGVDPFAIVLVARWRNSPNQAVDYGGAAFVLVKVERTYPFPGLAFYANYPTIFGGRPAMTRFAAQLEQGTAFLLSGENNLNDDRFRVLTVRRTTRTAIELRLNGTVDARASVASSLNVSAIGDPITLGGLSEAPFDGDIAELVAIAGPIPDDELLGLERFLMKKYALSSP